MQGFTPVGWDGSEFIWHTPSWTRKDHPGHELHLDRSTGFLWCSCEHSIYRGLGRNLMSAPSLGCKHARALAAALLVKE